VLAFAYSVQEDEGTMPDKIKTFCTIQVKKYRMEQGRAGRVYRERN